MEFKNKVEQALQMADKNAALNLILTAAHDELSHATLYPETRRAQQFVSEINAAASNARDNSMNAFLKEVNSSLGINLQ